MLYMFLADGFEETEAIGCLDVLRRAGVRVKTVSVAGGAVCGCHDIMVLPDIDKKDIDYEYMEGVILPGGMPGTLNLEKSVAVQAAIRSAMNNNAVVAAICAAPSILDHAGYLVGKKYTCYPGFESAVDGEKLDQPVVTDGNLTTGCGPGAAVDFALELVRVLVSQDKADEIAGGMQWR